VWLTLGSRKAKDKTDNITFEVSYCKQTKSLIGSNEVGRLHM